MTPEARTCFVNSVCYIKKFDRQKPIVHRVAQGREWALHNAGLLRVISNDNIMNMLFPEELRRQFGKDPEKYLAYYRENLEYLHPSAATLVVDEDVKGLGLSNRKIELLDRCVAMLGKGERPALALRILKRYTKERFDDAESWRIWLEKHRSRLFFTDVGGFKFLIVPPSIARKS